MPKVFDHFLDITSEVCPMTFVRTKMLLEHMQPGEIAEIHLPDGEPVENVPRAVREHGHEVLALDSDPSTPSVHTLRIRKRNTA